MEIELIQLRENPAHAAVSSAHQDTKRHKLLEKAQAEEEEEEVEKVGCDRGGEAKHKRLRDSCHEKRKTLWLE